MVGSVETTFVNVLTDQKDAIMLIIARATDAKELLRARAYLVFASPVWRLAGYGYKVDEVNKHIIDRAGHLIVVEKSELPHYRRGSRLHNFTLSEIAALEGVKALEGQGLEEPIESTMESCS
jgi:hypothetical protein